MTKANKLTVLTHVDLIAAIIEFDLIELIKKAIDIIMLLSDGNSISMKLVALKTFKEKK